MAEATAVAAECMIALLSCWKDCVLAKQLTPVTITATTSSIERKIIIILSQEVP